MSNWLEEWQRLYLDRKLEENMRRPNKSKLKYSNRLNKFWLKINAALLEEKPYYIDWGTEPYLNFSTRNWTATAQEINNIIIDFETDWFPNRDNN